MATSAHAQDTDARFRADVEKLLDVTGAAALGTQMATLVSNQFIEAMKQQRPFVPDGAIALIKEVLHAEFSKAFDGPDGMRAKLVDVYVKHFSHEEIIKILEFYSTDVGRKTVSLLPKLAQEGAAVGQQWALANMQRIAATIDE
ncbi:MAG TPA: DUF2059 domain-containing protein, partial [Vicinamibacterales bacterium]|nr:DUF2059 domain-containing protein [Vicinamibacterales bacterium]